MLAASLCRFHCGLSHPTRLILCLFEKYDAVIGVSNSALSISSKNPRCNHAVAATIIYLDSHIWQLQLLWDLLTLMVIFLVNLQLWGRCCQLNHLFESLQRPFLNLVESFMRYLRIFQIKCPKHELSCMFKSYSFARERLQFYFE